LEARAEELALPRVAALAERARAVSARRVRLALEALVAAQEQE